MAQDLERRISNLEQTAQVIGEDEQPTIVITSHIPRPGMDPRRLGTRQEQIARAKAENPRQRLIVVYVPGEGMRP
ncbi:MAG: hypothetical protein HY673_13905 [Chloroflexi bacterium]|nr:hypothetical protein [Chloroflexota bacterium]